MSTRSVAGVDSDLTYQPNPNEPQQRSYQRQLSDARDMRENPERSMDTDQNKSGQDAVSQMTDAGRKKMEARIAQMHSDNVSLINDHLARLAKRKKRPVVPGGPHVTDATDG
jgi:hypothetical protein